MKRKLLLLSMCLPLCACFQPPPSQISLYNGQKQAMADVDLSCGHQKPVALVNCRFDGYEAALRQAGFVEMKALHDMRERDLSTARMRESNSITAKEEQEDYKNSSLTFVTTVESHDNLRQVRYQRALANYLDNVNSSQPAYNPVPMPSFTPVSQPSMPPTTSYSPSANNGLMNSYIQPPPSPMGIGQGARGYGGTVFVPAGSNPNPPPNITGE